MKSKIQDHQELKMKKIKKVPTQQENVIFIQGPIVRSLITHIQPLYK